MTQDTGPISDALSMWEGAWSAQDPSAILSLWDHADGAATYLPAERMTPLVGATAVADYVNSACRLFDQIQHRIESPVFRRLSADTGLAFYALAWMFKDHKGPIGGTCRVTSVWRRTKDVWRLIHYAEAPLAPLLELQAFYESVAAQGLDSIPARDRGS